MVEPSLENFHVEVIDFERFPFVVTQHHRRLVQLLTFLHDDSDATEILEVVHITLEQQDPVAFETLVFSNLVCCFFAQQLNLWRLADHLGPPLAFDISYPVVVGKLATRNDLRVIRRKELEEQAHFHVELSFLVKKQKDLQIRQVVA